MTTPGGSYLPPVVAQVTGDSADLIRVLEDAKARLAEFARSRASATLRGDDGPLIDATEQAKLQLADFARQVARARLGADAAPFWADIAALRAEMRTLNPLNLDVDADTKAALAKIAGLRSALALASTDHLLAGAGAGAAGRGAAGTLAGGSLGALFGTGSAGVASSLLWGEAGGGFLSRLLSPISMLTTLFSAGFGSLGSFAGFGPEHLAMTLGGIAGTGVEAGFGGGLLALGSAGKDIVGGGSDALANRTAQAGVSGYMGLAQAVAEYGKNSAAAQAQANLLAFSMRGDSTAAKQAEAGIAAAAGTLRVQWHAASSAAQVESTKIMGQVLSLARNFMPAVANAARVNLALVSKGLQPLMTWLKGAGGHGVFNTLESTFRSTLPTAMAAFDNGMKLLLRTMALVAPQTGGLVRSLDKLFTRMNTPSGFAKWSTEVNKLIGDFRMWMALLKAAGHDLRSLFANDAGTPQEIIEHLTKDLQELGKWEDSAAGKASLFRLFTVHKDEIMQVGKALLQLGVSFGKIYLTAAPAMVTVMTGVLRVFNSFLRLLASNHATAFVAGLVLIAAKLGMLNPLFTMMKARVAAWALAQAKSIGDTIALYAMYAAEWVARTATVVASQIAATATVVASFIAQAAAATAAFIAENAATLGIIAGIMALVAGIVYLATHWKQVWSEIKTIAADVWKYLNAGWWKYLINPVAQVEVAIHALQVAWDATWGAIKTAASAAWRFIDSDVAQPIVNFFTKTVPDAGGKAIDWFKSLPGKIKTAIGDAATMLYDVGKQIIQGLINGVESMAGALGHAIEDVVTHPLSTVKRIFGINSPSSVFRDQVGVPIAQGIALGITQGMPGVQSSLAALTNLAKAPSVGFGGSTQPANPQLDRIERLLSQILSESKDTSTNTKATVNNTKQVVDATRGLSSPAGVAAQIAQSNARLTTAIRAGRS